MGHPERLVGSGENERESLDFAILILTDFVNCTNYLMVQ